MLVIRPGAGDVAALNAEQQLPLLDLVTQSGMNFDDTPPASDVILDRGLDALKKAKGA